MENPQDTLSWNHQFPIRWVILGTSTFSSVCISVQYLQDYKRKLNETGRCHKAQLFSGSSPTTWRNAIEAEAHHQKTCKCFMYLQLRSSAGGKKISK